MHCVGELFVGYGDLGCAIGRRKNDPRLLRVIDKMEVDELVERERATGGR